MPDLKAHSPTILQRLRGLFDIRYFFVPSTILPVMVINDKYYTPASTANATIVTAIDTAVLMTSRDDRNTYINSVYLSMEVDAITNVTSAVISCIQNGKTVVLIRLNSAAAAELNGSLIFPKPIIIDRNTAVTLDLSGDAATTEQITGIVSFSEEDAQEAFF